MLYHCPFPTSSGPHHQTGAHPPRLLSPSLTSPPATTRPSPSSTGQRPFPSDRTPPIPLTLHAEHQPSAHRRQLLFISFLPERWALAGTSRRRRRWRERCTAPLDQGTGCWRAVPGSTPSSSPLSSPASFVFGHPTFVRCESGRATAEGVAAAVADRNTTRPRWPPRAPERCVRTTDEEPERAVPWYGSGWTLSAGTWGGAATEGGLSNEVSMASCSALLRRCGTLAPDNGAGRLSTACRGGTRVVDDTGGSQASARVVLLC